MTDFQFKRIVILSGHYGSGKTNIALNIAFNLKKHHPRVTLADIDIVNPYFRTADSRGELEQAGISLISSEFASSNVDLPALPQQVYSVTDDRSLAAVIDVGGDDRGALALGRWRDAILEENNYEMLMVCNMYRPLTRTPEDTIEIMQEIVMAGGIPFTGIVNNSNLGCETTPETLLASADYIAGVCTLSGLPLRMTTAEEPIYHALEGKIPNLFPLRLQKRPIDKKE